MYYSYIFVDLRCLSVTRPTSLILRVDEATVVTEPSSSAFTSSIDSQNSLISLTSVDHIQS